MAQTTSELWRTLWNTKNTHVEYAFNINGVLYDPDTDAEVSHSVDHSLFDEFGIGNVTVAKLSLKLYADNIPRSATVKRYARLVNGETVSEWLPKGVFFVSRRAADEDLWSLDAYDALRKAEVVWEPDQSLTFPMTMPDAVAEFCRILGVELDERTVLNSAYIIDYPDTEYTIRKGLSYIAAAYGGNWTMTDEGRLWLVPLLPSGSAHEVGLDLVSLNDNGLRLPISRVTLWVDDENCYTSGDDTGLEIVADCPHATQAIVDALSAALVGYEYQAYTAGAVEIDPAAELGDPVNVGDMVSFVAAVSDKGNGYLDISAPGEQEMDDEYPDAGPIQQAFERKIARTRAEIKKTADSITLEVENQLSEQSASFEMALDGIQAQVTETDEKYTRMSQSVEDVTAQVVDNTKSLSLTLRIGADGLTITDAEGNTVEIDGKQLKANSVLADLITAGVLQSKDGETFVLDLDNGTFKMKGSGRFQSDNGRTYIEMDGDEIVLYTTNDSGTVLDKLHIGVVSADGLDYPYVRLGAGTGADGTAGLVKKFTNGLWIGNSVPQYMSGDFEGAPGAAGFFVDIATGESYVVNGTDMQNVYTGDAIATFG